MFVDDFAGFWHEGHELEGEQAGGGFVEVGFADLKHGEGCGNVEGVVEQVDFGVEVHDEDAVSLEFGEFFEGFVGAAFLSGTEFEEALHLGEEDFAIGFVYPAGLGVDLHLTGTVYLEEGKDVALEDLEFEFAFGEALLEEFGLECVARADRFQR